MRVSKFFFPLSLLTLSSCLAPRSKPFLKGWASTTVSWPRLPETATPTQTELTTPETEAETKTSTGSRIIELQCRTSSVRTVASRAMIQGISLNDGQKVYRIAGQIAASQVPAGSHDESTPALKAPTSSESVAWHSVPAVMMPEVLGILEEVEDLNLNHLAEANPLWFCLYMVEVPVGPSTTGP